MPEFSYRAMNNRGQMVTGMINGDNESAVRQNLKKEGLLPVEIKKGKSSLFALELPAIKLKKKISSAALSHFCRQLSVIIFSGVNLLKGLEIMAQQTPDKLMRSEVERMYRELQTGRTLSEVMAEQGSLMPELLTSMVATGEASGTLDEVLRNMAAFYEKEHRIRQKIKSASVYPIVLIVMAFGLIIFFFNFLLPQMVTLITASGGELPMLTRAVIGISNFIAKYYLILLAAALGTAVLLSRYLKTPEGRLNRDKCILRIPLLGKTLRHVATMRFARTAYILIKSGIPLLQGLEYIKQNVNNALAERAVDYAIEGLQRGESLAANLAKANYFDSMSIQMISVGEETGELEKLLEEMADFYEQESDTGFTKLLALAEPLMLLVIGSIVSIVIISVMLPMMDMFTHIRR